MLKRWIIRWLGLDARYVRTGDSCTEEERERLRRAIERQWELAEEVYSFGKPSNPYLEALQNGDLNRKPLDQVLQEIKDACEAQFGSVTLAAGEANR